MPQLRALGSSFSFLPDNTDFGAVTYKRKKINVLQSEHFPMTCQTIQGFLQAEMFSVMWVQGALPLDWDPAEIPPQVTRVPFAVGAGAAQTTAQTMPMISDPV